MRKTFLLLLFCILSCTFSYALSYRNSYVLTNGLDDAGTINSVPSETINYTASSYVFPTTAITMGYLFRNILTCNVTDATLSIPISYSCSGGTCNITFKGHKFNNTQNWTISNLDDTVNVTGNVSYFFTTQTFISDAVFVELDVNVTKQLIEVMNLAGWNYTFGVKLKGSFTGKGKTFTASTSEAGYEGLPSLTINCQDTVAPTISNVAPVNNYYNDYNGAVNFSCSYYDTFSWGNLSVYVNGSNLVTVSPENISQNKTITNSSQYDVYIPSYANDGNWGTQWVSSQSTSTNASEWLLIDLGQAYYVDRLRIYWLSFYIAKNFSVWTNTSTTAFSNAYSKSGNSQSMNDVIFSSPRWVRNVRINLTEQTSAGFGFYSITEVFVYKTWYPYNFSTQCFTNGSYSYYCRGCDESGNCINDSSRNFIINASQCVYCGVGNWNPPCTCTINTNTNLNGNNLTLNTIGDLTLSANVTNVNVFTLVKGCIFEIRKTLGSLNII